MQNKAMLRKLACNAAIDVDAPGVALERTPEDRADAELAGADVWRLARFEDGKDYCSSSHEAWIWSIGRRGDGAIFAARDSRFYLNPRFECLFLR